MSINIRLAKRGDRWVLTATIKRSRELSAAAKRLQRAINEVKPAAVRR